MTSTIRALAGGGLIALGEAIRGGAPNVDLDLPHEFGAMESDGPLLAQPQLLRADNAIAPAEIREALDELPDSQLLTIAATIVAGWKPILFTTDAGRGASRDVDVLIEALRDRAAQFAAVEVDAERPFLTSAHLGAHLTNSAQTRPE